MAKAKSQASEPEPLVETVQDNNFADRLDLKRETRPRGPGLQEQIDTIRAARAAQRAVHGRAGKKRKITNYHDAERLRNLCLLTAEEHVDCEEEGLFPDPAQYQTGSTASALDSEPPDASPPGESD